MSHSNKRILYGAVLSVVAFILSFSDIYAVEPIDRISMWVRAEGDHADNAITERINLVEIALKDIKTRKRRLVDAQYHEKNWYQSVRLRDLFSDYSIPKNTDLVILHFQNGMVIPVPIREAKKNNIYLATAIGTRSKGKINYSADFPEIAKEHIRYNDPRPIKFRGNKIVIKTLSNPEGYDTMSFSPWRHVDSLVSLEFANREAYRNQFGAKGKSEEDGAKVFLARCQFCHAVRLVGGSFGWDFVNRLPIYQKRNPESLYYHVKYENLEALERGLMMPSQETFTPEEAKDVWSWAKYVAENPLVPYRIN